MPDNIDIQKIKLCIKKLNGILIPRPATCSDNRELATTLMAEMMQYGYIMNNSLYNRVKTLPKKDIVKLHSYIIPGIKQIKGCNVEYKPMYPNFPTQVMESTFEELFMNAVVHYWTSGEWTPDYEELPRELWLEETKYIELGIVTEEKFFNIFDKIVSSKESISEEDRKTLEWFIQNEPKITISKEIPYKENMCVVAGMMLNMNMDIEPLMKTTTDVLRVMTYLSGGDISLAENTKFKSFPRKYRRVFASILNKIGDLEDFNRHRGKWVRALHGLHIGEYAKSFLSSEVKKIRSNDAIQTWMGYVQYEIENKNHGGLVKLLKERPGEFARRLDHVMRLFPEQQEMTATLFNSVIKDIPTRILLQLSGHLKVRNIQDHRVVFPKGQTQLVKLIESSGVLIEGRHILSICNTIDKTLKSRFEKLEPLGNIYIDEELKHCPIPTQQRSSSSGVFNLARGTKFPFGDKNTLRFFIYWKGMDIDLSATLHDNNFDMVEEISYTHLKSEVYNACHSGDVIEAALGACEFIDITIDKAFEYGARYIVMNVLVYNGPVFKEHEICYAGWMTREKPDANAIYDPKTVEQKIDLRSNSKNVIPVVFDLKERKAIWCDFSTKMNLAHGGNNIHSNYMNIQQALKSIVTLSNKITLYDLFIMHGRARGKIIENKEDADTVFSLKEGLTPFHVNDINSEYIV